MRRIHIRTINGMVEPYVAGTEVRVSDVLRLLSEGLSYQNIIEDHLPTLLPDDIVSCARFAKKHGKKYNLPLVEEPNFRRLPYDPGIAASLLSPLVIAVACSAILVFIIYRLPAPGMDPMTTAKAQKFIEIGDRAYAKEQYYAAEEAYQAALSSNPHDPFAYNNLGLVYDALNRIEEAEQMYRRSIELDPFDPVVRYNLGLLLYRQQKYQPAISEYQVALKYNPTDVDAMNNLGNALFQLNRFEEAVQWYQKALDEEPNYTLARENRDDALLQIQQGQTNNSLTK